MSVLDRLRARDPDLISLRKAGRATIVVVPLFAIMNVWLGLGALSTFAFFACFVGLVFANFGGPRLSRALAYIAMTLIGNVLIVIGSLLSDTLGAAVVVTFVVIFATSFAAVLGGYAPAFMAPSALSFALAVLDPLSAVPIDTRVYGWTIGGLTAMVAALVLWPVDRRVNLRRTLADACDGIATAVESIDTRDAAEAGYRRAEAALIDARHKTGEPFRPGGPLSRDIGLLHLVEHLEQAVDMTRRVLDAGRIPDRHAPLATTCARTYRRASGILLQEVDPDGIAEDLPQLDTAMTTGGRIADAAAMHAADTAPADEDKGEDALEMVRRTFPIMALSHIAMWVDACAATALGAKRSVVATKTTPELRTFSDEPTAVFHRIGRILSRGLDPDGVIFRNSVRAAAAMSLAILIAKVVPVEHGFWVALAALLVLHSSAASTTATALQAVVGTVIGFVIAAAILWLFGTNPLILWGLLLVGIFFSAYTPDAVGFMVGQVCFTTMVVVFFTLVEPAGIATAVARLETVALGAASGAVMAFILWPHGAREALARAIATVYRASSDSLRIITTDPQERHRDAVDEIHGARRHAEEAFTIALSERGRRINTRAWMSLFRAPNMANSLVFGIWSAPSPWLFEHCGDATDATIAHRGRVADAMQRVAARLDGTGPTTAATPEKPVDLTAILVECLDRARPFGPDKIDDVRILIALNEWVSYVEEDIAAAAPDLAYVAETSQQRAWMHWSLPKTEAPPRAAK